jgi:hypothetical protein
LLHELAHAFIAGKSGRTAPRWLHEGIAQLIEGRTTPRPVAIAMAKRFEESRGSGSWGRTFSYPSALSFVEYLESREGFFRLVEVLVEMSRGTKADAAFQEVTRYSLDELRTAWGEDLAVRYLP